MNRRIAIRNMGFVAAGALLLPACMQEEKASVVLKNIPLTGAQERMLAALCDVIIPKTNDFIGAADVKAHEFVLTMMDDCASPDEQKTFTNGMQLFEAACKKENSSSFEKCTPEQKISFLKKMEANSNNEGDENKFYAAVKRYTIQSFTSSKKYLTDIKHYNIVPGSNFKGCVPLGKSS